VVECLPSMCESLKENQNEKSWGHGGETVGVLEKKRHRAKLGECDWGTEEPRQ
jgi:hypothetical protein